MQHNEADLYLQVGGADGPSFYPIFMQQRQKYETGGCWASAREAIVAGRSPFFKEQGAAKELNGVVLLVHRRLAVGGTGQLAAAIDARGAAAAAGEGGGEGGGAGEEEEEPSGLQRCLLLAEAAYELSQEEVEKAVMAAAAGEVEGEEDRDSYTEEGPPGSPSAEGGQQEQQEQQQQQQQQQEQEQQAPGGSTAQQEQEQAQPQQQVGVSGGLGAGGRVQGAPHRSQEALRVTAQHAGCSLPLHPFALLLSTA